MLYCKSVLSHFNTSLLMWSEEQFLRLTFLILCILPQIHLHSVFRTYFLNTKLLTCNSFQEPLQNLKDTSVDQAHSMFCYATLVFTTPAEEQEMSYEVKTLMPECSGLTLGSTSGFQFPANADPGSSSNGSVLVSLPRSQGTQGHSG